MNATATCSTCGKSYPTWKAWLRKAKSPYCSTRCNGAARGREWARHGHKGRAAWTAQSRCSFRAKMSGPRNPSWKGGVTLKRNRGNYKGAISVRCPEWAAPMRMANGYIMEHRLVMAAWCGRMLTRAEAVNHINHDPHDNRRENLELWPDNRSHKLAEHGRFVEGAANSVSLPA